MARLSAQRFQTIFYLTVLVYAGLVLVKLSTIGDVVQDKSKERVEKSKKLETFAENSNRPVISRKATLKISEDIGGVCPKISPFLLGNASVDLNDTSLDLSMSIRLGGEVEFGGSWQPKNCTPRKKIAILVPYRNRTLQLNVFLRHMHPILQRQQLDYRIFVIEQIGKEKFNKGAIYNIGFNETSRFGEFDCHIFHDIDLLCEDDRNYYGCVASPMHMSVGIDKFDYKLSYPALVGGIQLFTKRDYVGINGYSNKFWGWGGEDDNLFTRIKAKGLKLVRPSVEVARYKMNQEHHFRSDPWSKANQVLIYHRRPRQDTDGLNSIKTLSYTLEVRESLLYTLIAIDLKKT